MVSSIIGRSVSTAGTIASKSAASAAASGKSINSAKNVHSATTPVSPTTGASMVGSAGGALWGLVYMLFFALVVWFLPIFVEYLKKVFAGIDAISQRWIVAVRNNGGDRSYWWQSIFFFVFRVVPVTVSSIINRAVKPFLKNILVILVTAVVVVVFTFLNRHFHEVVEGMSDVSDLFVTLVNVLGLAFEVLVDAVNLFLPITNFIEHTGMILIIAIYDAITLSIESFGSPHRVLSALGSDEFFVSLRPIILLWQTISSASLHIQLAVIDIAARTGLIYAATYLVSYIVAVVAKLCCLLADIPCGILELLDALIYDYIVDIVVNGFLGLFGASVEITHNIACVTSVLTTAHITSACYGSVLSWESGYYRNAPRTGGSGRRNTMACVSQGGKWIETINGGLVHASSSPTDSCPHIRAALTSPYGNALNLEKMDEHGCYISCIRNVKVETCADGATRYIGSCGSNSTLSLSHREASRRLMGMFGEGVTLMGPDEGRGRGGRGDRELAGGRAEAIQMLTEKFQPLQFQATFGACDLTRAPTGPIDAFYDLLCLSTKLFPTGGGEGRGGEAGGEGGALMQVVSSLRHTGRKLATHDPKEGTMPLDNPLLLVGWAFHNVSRGRGGRGGGRGGRKLSGEDSRPCEEGEKLCLNGFQCVLDDAGDAECMVRENLGPIELVRYYLMMAHNIVTSFDIKDSIHNVYICWRYLIANPEYDRYDASNLFVSDEDIVGDEFTYCYPMLKPTGYTWTRWRWSLRDEFYGACAATSSNFGACYCPMYYPIGGPSVYYGDYVSSDILYVVLNGLIFFKNAFVLLCGGWLGYVWSSVFAEPAVPREVSRAFSLYSHDLPPEVYWICGGFQIGSAATLILFVWVVYAGFRVAVDVFEFILSGGMTQDERAEEYRQRNIKRRLLRLEAEQQARSLED